MDSKLSWNGFKSDTINAIKLANGLIINYGKIFVSDDHNVIYKIPYTGDSFVLVSIENSIDIRINTIAHDKTGFSYATNGVHGANFMFLAIGT